MTLPVHLAFSPFTITSTFHFDFFFPLCQASSICWRYRSAFEHMQEQRGYLLDREVYNLYKYPSESTVECSRCLTEAHPEQRRAAAVPKHVIARWEKKIGKFMKKICETKKNDWRWDCTWKMTEYLSYLAHRICVRTLSCHPLPLPPNAAISFQCHFIPFRSLPFHTLLCRLPPLVCHQNQIDNIFFLPFSFSSLPRSFVLSASWFSFGWVCGCRHRFFFHSRDYTFVFCWMWLRVVFPLFTSNASDVTIMV